MMIIKRGIHKMQLLIKNNFANYKNMFKKPVTTVKSINGHETLISNICFLIIATFFHIVN